MTDKEVTVKQERYKFTLKDLVQIFIDFDRISSQEWDKKYGARVAALARHFNMPPESILEDTLRTAMEAVLKTGKPIEIHPGQSKTREK